MLVSYVSWHLCVQSAAVTTAFQTLHRSQLELLDEHPYAEKIVSPSRLRDHAWTLRTLSKIRTWMRPKKDQRLINHLRCSLHP